MLKLHQGLHEGSVTLCVFMYCHAFSTKNVALRILSFHELRIMKTKYLSVTLSVTLGVTLGVTSLGYTKVAGLCTVGLQQFLHDCCIVSHHWTMVW